MSDKLIERVYSLASKHLSGFSIGEIADGHFHVTHDGKDAFLIDIEEGMAKIDVRDEKYKPSAEIFANHLKTKYNLDSRVECP